MVSTQRLAVNEVASLSQQNSAPPAMVVLTSHLPIGRRHPTRMRARATQPAEAR